MTDEQKPAPTHTLTVKLITGDKMQEHFTEAYEESCIMPGHPDKARPVEGYVLKDKTIEVFKADGTRLIIERDRTLFHAVFPYQAPKPLPEPVKARLELAKGRNGRTQH